jgi:2-dehydropantoate 2-reductase
LPESSVAAVLGEENTVGCAISWGATFIGDGVCALTSKKNKWTFALGTPYDNAQKLNMVLPYLQCMGKVTIEDNFLGARWSKLIINSAFSGISAVTGLTFGQIAKDKKARHIVQAMLKEGMDTAMLNGVKPAKIQGHDIVRLLYYRGNLKKALSFAIIPLAMHSHKNLVSGMYYDLKNKKCCDMPFICGAVAQAASKAGKRAKLNELAVSIAEDIISGKRVIGVDNLMLFYNCM